MRTYLAVPLAVFLWCGALWFFADALASREEIREQEEARLWRETVLEVGNKSPCMTKVNLSVWDSMNELEIYRWVVTCEDELAATSGGKK